VARGVGPTIAMGPPRSAFAGLCRWELGVKIWSGSYEVLERYRVRGGAGGCLEGIVH